MIGIMLTILFFVFPGFLLTQKKDFFPRWSFVEKIPLSIALSLAYWIIGFWLLRFLPIPLSWFIRTSLFASICIWCIHSYRRRKSGIRGVSLHRMLPMIIPSAYIVVLALPALFIATHQLAPSGADMSMHAYLAKTIYLWNGFPTSGLPLVPTPHFGNYPIGFSTILADMMLLNGLPVYTNAVWLTAFVYWFFSVCMFILVRSVYSFPISALTALLVSWLSRTPHDVIYWGANPTVLSFNFLILAVTFILHGKNRWSLPLALTMLYTAILTHVITPTGFLYLFLIFLPICLPHIIRSAKNIRNPRMFIGLAIVIMAPLLLHIIRMDWHVSDATQSFVAGLQREEFPEWSGVFDWTILTGISEYMKHTFDSPIIIAYILALCIIGLSHRRSLLPHMVIILGTCLLILNSKAWLLPFSSLLYPKRIALLLLIPMALGIATALQDTIRVVCRVLTTHTPHNKIIAHGLIFLLIGFITHPYMQATLKTFTASADLSIVTQEDLEGFRWLTAHTTEKDVILNNYFDAGLWIPAITDRQITLYHTNPIDMDSLGINQGKETYAYIGNASLIPEPDTDLVNASALEKNPKRYTLVYTNANVKIYRVEQ